MTLGSRLGREEDLIIYLVLKAYLTLYRTLHTLVFVCTGWFACYNTTLQIHIEGCSCRRILKRVNHMRTANSVCTRLSGCKGFFFILFILSYSLDIKLNGFAKIGEKTFFCIYQKHCLLPNHS